MHNRGGCQYAPLHSSFLSVKALTLDAVRKEVHNVRWRTLQAKQHVELALLRGNRRFHSKAHLVDARKVVGSSHIGHNDGEDCREEQVALGALTQLHIQAVLEVAQAVAGVHERRR